MHIYNKNVYTYIYIKIKSKKSETYINRLELNIIRADRKFNLHIYHTILYRARAHIYTLNRCVRENSLRKTFPAAICTLAQTPPSQQLNPNVYILPSVFIYTYKHWFTHLPTHQNHICRIPRAHLPCTHTHAPTPPLRINICSHTATLLGFLDLLYAQYIYSLFLYPNC